MTLRLYRPRSWFSSGRVKYSVRRAPPRYSLRGSTVAFLPSIAPTVFRCAVIILTISAESSRYLARRYAGLERGPLRPVAAGRTTAIPSGGAVCVASNERIWCAHWGHAVGRVCERYFSRNRRRVAARKPAAAVVAIWSLHHRRGGAPRADWRRDIRLAPASRVRAVGPGETLYGRPGARPSEQGRRGG